MITASAPGKIILLGEHAVVYGHPALAVPVSEVQARAEVTPSTTPGVHLHALDIGLEAEVAHLNPQHPLARAVSLVFEHLGVFRLPDIDIHITSTIPVASGLGSGAAVSVAVMRALAGFVGKSLPDDQVCDLAFEVEKLHHGTPSGIDNTVVTFAAPVYFIKGQPMERLTLRSPFHLVIADTGISAPTKEAVADVRRLWQAQPARIIPLLDAIGELASAARENLLSGDRQALGALMTANHTLLQQLTVSCPVLDDLVSAALGNGALGAKLSGGGRGGNMVALVEQENAPVVAGALRKAGAKGTILTRVG